MSQPDGNNPPRLYPTMRCKDAEAMIAWLKNVLGFASMPFIARTARSCTPNWRSAHQFLMLGADRDDAYATRVGDLKGRRTDALYLAVSDPETLYQKIKASGARIEVELHNTDYGSRDFSARDPEGGLWTFGTYWPKVGEAPLPG
jgi:uncharacterized glyoxalase superfamily protein PhnB